MSNTNPTQAQAILSRLEMSRGEWVAMTELGKYAGCWAVHSRIAEIRTKHGRKVENKTKRVEGKTHSYYRLIA
jgi:hypothetical protein